MLAKALQSTGARRVVDLGSGSAGPWLGLLPQLRALGVDVNVCLSDYLPDVEALERARQRCPEAFTYSADSVDAAQVPLALRGFRTMFSAFHHLHPNHARAVLADAVTSGEGIAIFECGNRRPLTLLLAALTTAPRALLTAPFIRPFRWPRLFWTYPFPILPVVLAWDVTVSCLRIYSEPELHALTAGLSKYDWDIGTLQAQKTPIVVTYLVGVPRKSNA